MSIAARSASGQRPDYAGTTIAVAFVLCVALTVLFLGMLPFVGHPAASCDYVAYWATGQQLVHHANPYDGAAMARLEHAAALRDGSPCYMRNPPWGLPLTLPLGLVSERVGILPWSLLMLGLLFVSVRTMWNMVGRPGSRLDLLGYAFPPALLCAVMGQTSLFLLLGLVLFLKLHRTRPFWAGAALWLCTLKPHLFLPFGIVLLVWIVVSRGYRVLLGAGVMGAVSVLFSLWVDPAAFSEYSEWAHSSGIAHQPIPCLGVLLRDMVNPSAEWLAFVPAVFACSWTLWYFWRNRKQWDWVENGVLVALVSMVAAPYCFIFDQSLAIPALLYGASRLSSRWPLTVLAGFYVVFEMQPLLAPQVLAPGWMQLFAASAWLVWYMVARRFDHPQQLVTAAVPVPG
ncbi:MAG TPA: glycosyltransferase 87 family protein [Acidobacteriaceae bacterium]|jgi:hypothetical protein|nr:glycosyltransferase 87 family protein [Acidobacteriaceae bacterium]